MGSKHDRMIARRLGVRSRIARKDDVLADLNRITHLPDRCTKCLVSCRASCYAILEWLVDDVAGHYKFLSHNPAGLEYRR